MANYPVLSGLKSWTPMSDFDPMWVDSPSLLNKSWNQGTSPLHEMAKVPDKIMYGYAADGKSLWLIDAATDETWLSFKLPEIGVVEGVLAKGGVDVDTVITGIAFANGSIFVLVSEGAITAPGLYVLDLIQDIAVFFDDSGTYEYIGRLRDEGRTWSLVNVGTIRPGFLIPDTLFVIAGEIPVVSYGVDNAGAGEINILYYKGLETYSAYIADAGFNYLGVLLNRDCEKELFVGTETAIGDYMQTLVYEHIASLPDGSALALADAKEAYGVCGDTSAWLNLQRLHGAVLNGESLNGGVIVKTEKSDSILESQLCTFISTDSAAKVTVIKQLQSGTSISRTMDNFAFRPYSMVGVNGTLGNDYIFAQFGTTSAKFLTEFSPFSSWLWNNGTTDITPRANTMTLVAAPVWNAAGYLPLDGATQYAHADVAIPFTDAGFTVFATLQQLGSAGTIISKYDEGAAPLTSIRMFRFFISAGREVSFRVWDSSVCRTGVDTYIGRKSFVLPAFAFTRNMQLIGIYRGNANLAGSANIEIWMNGIRIDIADDEANAAAFVEIEDVAGVDLSIGADYTNGAAARFLTTTAICRVGILYGTVSYESIGRFYQLTASRVMEETGATGTNPLQPAATNVEDVFDYWVSAEDAECPYNAYLDFDSTDDAYVALPNSALTAATTGLFVSFWIKPVAFAAKQTLISKTAAAYEIGIGGIAAGGADDHIHVQLNTNALGGGADLISTNSLVADAWNHVVLYYNSTFGSVVLIVNGEVTTEAYAVAVTAVAGAVFSVGQRAGATQKFDGGFCGLRVAVNAAAPVLNFLELTELVREEYALGLGSLSVVKKFNSINPISFVQDSARPVMMQNFYAYVTDEDGEISEILTIPDGSRTKTYSSVFYSDDGNRNIVYDDGTREIATIVTQTDDQKVQMAIRQAVAKAVQRDDADKVAYFSVTISTALSLPLPTETIIVMDSTGGSRTIYLPPATGCKGKKITVKKVDATANTAGMTPNGTDTIDTVNAAITTAVQFEALTVYCDGTAWFLV